MTDSSGNKVQLTGNMGMINCVPEDLNGVDCTSMNGTQFANSVPRCFQQTQQPSSANPSLSYGSLHMKNACLAQLPFDTWGNFASLANQTKPTPYTTTQFADKNFAPTSPEDVLARFWRSPHLHLQGQASTRYNIPEGVGGLLVD